LHKDGQQGQQGMRVQEVWGGEDRCENRKTAISCESTGNNLGTMVSQFALLTIKF